MNWKESDELKEELWRDLKTTPQQYSSSSLFTEMNWKKMSNELEKDWHLRATVAAHCSCYSSIFAEN